MPHFSDIARPLSKLTEKVQIFKWTDLCQASFKMLKEKLCYELIQNTQIHQSHIHYSQMQATTDGQEFDPRTQLNRQ